MGKEGEGWKVAMATLTFERGATGGQAGGLSMMDLSINDVVELARRAKRNGRQQSKTLMYEQNWLT